MTRKACSVPSPAESTGPANPPAGSPASRRERTVAKPTGPQKALFRSIIARPEFTDAERAVWLDWLATKATKRTLIAMINYVKVARWRRTPHDAAAYAQPVAL